VLALEIVFWVALGLIVWAHLGYPLAAGLLARLRPRPVAKAAIEPTVALVVAAHDEEEVIVDRIENLLALDYPPEKLQIVVASDGSGDRTDEIVSQIASREPRVSLLACPRGGKTLAQNRAVRETSSEILAFTDANTEWAPDALRRLVSDFADPDVAYVSGKLQLRASDGSNREGLYWRYELWLRSNESMLGSITAGNGAIYAVRREDYFEDPSITGHDFGLPFRMVQRGRRAVFESDATAYENESRDLEDEFGRKVRMITRALRHVYTGGMLRGVPPIYAFELLSHRLLRYSTGIVHLVLLGASVALVVMGPPGGWGFLFDIALGCQLAWLLLALLGRLRVRVPGAGIAYYYYLVTLATLVGQYRFVRFGTPTVWEKAEGTR
jgi:cellulose synthase/poly-beta-1,6-N-acetylglucosamine synthase-like glycosyltransferase